MTRSLIDTNVLVYAHNKDSLYHQESRKLVESFLNSENQMVLAVQNLVEFYAVITDRKRVEHSLSSEKTRRLLEFYLNNEQIEIIYPDSRTLHTLTKLIGQYKPSGQTIFDYLLAATIFDNGVSQIYTFNTKHFKVFDFLKVIHPLSAL